MLKRAALRRRGDAGERLQARIHLQRVGGDGDRVARPRARSRSASATATAVLPTPVGPNSAITSARAGRARCVVHGRALP